jgi:hypothetical protein
MNLVRNILILAICISSYANAQSSLLKKESGFKVFSQDKSTKNYNIVCGDILNASPRYNISSVSGTARIAGYFLDRIRFRISKFGYNGGKLEESEDVDSE